MKREEKYLHLMDEDWRVGAAVACSHMASEPSSPPALIRVLLVDDHVVVRQGLKMVLGLEEDFEIVGEASNGEEAVVQAAKLQPDVVLMDLLMPVMNGVDAIRAIKARQPEIEIRSEEHTSELQSRGHIVC